MSQLNLSLAVCDYDHLRDIVMGTVRPQGVEITPMLFDEPHVIFHRATNYAEFDINEMSFGRYISLVSQRKNGMIAIPVFPSRVARIGAFYVRAGSKVKVPEDLAGKRIGVPEWAQTATIYARGWLAHHVGVDLKSISWFQTGVDQPGRPEPVKLKLPKGMKVTPVTDRSLSQMLLEGDIDCALTALPPKPFRDGDKRIKKLVPITRRPAFSRSCI
jgi:4,5-dihydroxyphthalate decarboxylase